MKLNEYIVGFWHPRSHMLHSTMKVEAMNPWMAEREARLKFNEIHAKENANAEFYYLSAEEIQK